MWENSKNRLALCKILKILVSSHIVYHEAVHMTEIQTIQNKIYEVRGQRVMLDFDLAELYQVETRVLNQAVKRNLSRFPEDFMFQLSENEWSLISSQFVMTSRAKRPKSALPFAFTEHGALMLSSVLKSTIAIETSINITRAFVYIRQALTTLSLPSKLSDLERKIENLRAEMNDILEDQNDINESTQSQLDAISIALAELQSKEPRQTPRRRIGFIQNDETIPQ